VRLTSFTNYALRTLQLAALRDPELVRSTDVVRVHGLARPHIGKVVHELGRAGYLKTVRGRAGGFRLARPANEIKVGEIVRLTEGPLEIVECFTAETNTCPLLGVCRLSVSFRRALDAFLDVLDGVTIADIAANRPELMARIEPLDKGLVIPKGKRS